MLTLDSLKNLLAVIGGVSLVVGPLASAWLTVRAHRAVSTAPAFIELSGRVTATERWQDEHAADVKYIPQLTVILERVEQTLSQLVKRFDERL